MIMYFKTGIMGWLGKRVLWVGSENGCHGLARKTGVMGWLGKRVAWVGSEKMYGGN